MTFKEKLVVLRKIKNLTQDEFASAVGVSRQAVYKWESGQSYPEAMKLWEIKLLFGISIDDLLDDTFEVELPKKKRRRRAKADADTNAVANEVAEAPVAAEVVAEAPAAEEAKEEAPAAAIEEVETAASEMVAAAVEAIDTAIAENEAEEEVEEEVAEEPEAEDVLPPVKEVPQNPDRVSEILQKKGFFGRLFGKK